jgi:hypothetical protein
MRRTHGRLRAAKSGQINEKISPVEPLNTKRVL